MYYILNFSAFYLMFSLIGDSIIREQNKTLDTLKRSNDELIKLIKEYKRQKEISNIFINPDGKIIYEDNECRAVIRGLDYNNSLVYYTTNMIIKKNQHND